MHVAYLGVRRAPRKLELAARKDVGVRLGVVRQQLRWAFARCLLRRLLACGLSLTHCLHLLGMCRGYIPTGLSLIRFTSMKMKGRQRQRFRFHDWNQSLGSWLRFSARRCRPQ